jgi:hypothetical protein
MLRLIRNPAFTARSLTLGTLYNIVFGTLWIGNGLLALQNIQPLFLFVALAVVTLALLVVCLSLFRSVRRFPLQMPAGELRCKNRAINRATIIELVGSTVLSILLVLVGRSELMLPMIVLSVGLYLLAVAPVLRLVHYYIAGALLCLLPILIVLLIPVTMPLAGAGASLGASWLILVGLIGGSIQFGLASVNLSLTISLRRILRAGKIMEGVAHG